MLRKAICSHMMNFHRHLPCNSLTVSICPVLSASPPKLCGSNMETERKTSSSLVKFFETPAGGKNCMLIDCVLRVCKSAYP